MMKWLCARRKLLVGALGLAIFIVVVIPLQTFLSCTSAFDFSMAALLCQTVGYAMAVTGGIFVTVAFFPQKIMSWIEVLFVATLLCLYLETSFLSIGLPSINGVSGFTDIVRSVFDAGVWIVVFVSCILSRRYIQRYYYLFICGIGIMSLASLIDSKSESVNSSSPLSEGFVPKYDVAMNTELSTNRNIIVLILDMTPGTLAARLMRSSPELQDRFPGFVAFEQNLGMHEETALGLPGLLTGKYMDETIGREDYGMSMFGTNSFLYSYMKSNSAVYFSGGLYDFGYTNRKKHDFTKELAVNQQSDTRKSPLMKHSNEIPNLRLLDAMCIRVVPYYFKNYFLNKGLLSASRDKPKVPSANSEKFIFKKLADSTMSDEALVLAFYHTNGLHWPIDIDRYGKKLAIPITMPSDTLSGDSLEECRQAMSEKGYHVFSLLADLLDALQRKKIYDNSTIIIASDHGCIAMKEGCNHGAESSILWVKPEGSRDHFKFNSSPTSNCRISDLVLALKSSSLSIDKMVEILSQEKRVFRADYHGVTLHRFGGTLHYSDWIYDSKGNLENIVKH